MTLLEEILRAEKRIRSSIKETKLEYAPILSEMGNCDVYLKLENQQKTGSFKIRGALNSLISYSADKDELEFVTASSGNHGAAFAYGITKLGLKGTIFLPRNASPIKVKALKEKNVEVILYGDDCVQAEIFARNYAEKRNLTYISPYNDLLVVAGQGTIGIELEKQIEELDYILVPVGGGGLISGIAGYFKSKSKTAKIIGSQPLNSPVMYESIKAGKILAYDSLPTLSDGTAGGLESDSITFGYCKNYVDDYVLVSEDEIRNALRFLYNKHEMIVEGAAALTIAAFIQKIKVFQESKVVLLISGSSIDEKEFEKIIA